MKRWISAALLPAGMGLLGLGLGTAPLPAQAQVELSMSAWVPPSHMLVKDGMVPWMKEVERVTQGRVKIKLLPKPVTNPVNHFDAVRDGLADVAFVSHAYTPARFRRWRMRCATSGWMACRPDARQTGSMRWCGRCRI